MMEIDSKLGQQGCVFDPSRYAHGYSRVQVLLSGAPTQRFYDIKALHLLTYDGKNTRRTTVTRHELALEEKFQVCLGQVQYETHHGESLRAFTFGGELSARVETGDLFCKLSSTAPIFRLHEDPKWPGEVIADEIMDMLAEKQARLAGHEDELHARLAKHSPYEVFLACLISLRKRLDAVPVSLRRERYQRISSMIKGLIQMVKETDGWDGSAPDLDELLSKGGK